MNEQEIIKEAFYRGYFWDRRFPDVLNVKETDLPILTMADTVVKHAMASLQMSDANLRHLVQIHHKRMPVYDGDVGPATLDLIDLPRCPMPDYPPPPNASFHYDDPGLQKAVETMQEFASSGTGSWPASGCDPDRRGVHSFRVRINMDGAPSTVKAYIDESLAACIQAYADVGVSVRYILDATSPAEIVKHFESMSGGVIGWNYFPQPNSCSRITGAFNRTYAPSMQTWANLECHESGHGCGLPHTNGGIMNPSIITFWPLTWRGDPSFNRLKAFFGGEPMPLPVPPVTSWLI